MAGMVTDSKSVLVFPKKRALIWIKRVMPFQGVCEEAYLKYVTSATTQKMRCYFNSGYLRIKFR
jgi:hypothetical protein